MNPYLERDAVWHGFHETFIPYAQEVLNAQLNPQFIAKIDEHVFIHELPDDAVGKLVGRSDIDVAEIALEASAASATVLEAPAEVRLPNIDVERVSYLEIRDREDWRLVTVIGLLSPSNKYAGPDREHLAKRTTSLHSTAHFVEIDLLRGGPRLPLENLPACDYYVLVSRYEKRPRADVWPIQLRDRLPVIPVPLTASHADAELDLKGLLDRVYTAAGFEHYVYRQPPEPRLSQKDAEWSQQFVPTR